MSSRDKFLAERERHARQRSHQASKKNEIKHEPVSAPYADDEADLEIMLLGV